jgi:hypothetical protein
VRRKAVGDYDHDDEASPPRNDEIVVRTVCEEPEYREGPEYRRKRLYPP